MTSAYAQLDPLGGTVLADRAIREAIGSGDIRIVAPDPTLVRERSQEGKFQFGDFHHYVNALHANNPAHDRPQNCLESTGYQLFPLRYYDRRSGRWRLIPRGDDGFELKPGREVVIEPQQYVGFSHKYCALHLARFSGQLSGVSIGTGLIQPNWGAASQAPIFTSVRNIGNKSVHIRRNESLSRLVFFRVSGEIMNPSAGTSIDHITSRIEKDQTELRRRNSETLWRRRLIYLLIFAVLASALWWLPIVLPLVQVDSGINEYIGQGILAILAVLGAQFIRAEKRDDL
jgi:hypothetical protein